MVRSMIITEEMKQTICEKLREYLRANAVTLECSYGVSKEHMDAAMLERLLAFRYVPKYEEWKAALERMAKGTYGICMLCHRPIPREELEPYPLARFCCKCERGFSFPEHETDSPRRILVTELLTGATWGGVVLVEETSWLVS